MWSKDSVLRRDAPKDRLVFFIPFKEINGQLLCNQRIYLFVKFEKFEGASFLPLQSMTHRYGALQGGNRMAKKGPSVVFYIQIKNKYRLSSKAERHPNLRYLRLDEIFGYYLNYYNLKTFRRD